MTQPPSEKQSGEKKPGKTEEAPPARRNWAGSVGRDVGFVGAAAFVRAGFADPALVLHWPEIAGVDVARIARPVRFSPKDGILTLLAEPAAALFLGHESRALMDRINAYLGREAVLRINFVQCRLALGTRPQPPRCPAINVKNNVQSISYNGPDKGIAALQSLARWRAATGSEGG